MKKIGAILILVIFLFSLTSLISAEIGPVLPKEVERLHEIGEKATDEAARSEYLKQEWTKMLEKSKIGKFMNKTQEYVKPVNPVIKLTFGLEFSWSWVFFLTLSLWFFILMLFYRTINVFVSIKKIIKILISLALIIIISAFGLTKIAAEYIIKAISLMPNLALQVITIVFLIAVFVFFSSYANIFKQIAKKLKKEKEIDDIEEDVEEIKEEAKKPKSEKKEITKEDEEKAIKEEAKSEIEGIGDED
tara:strand:+ start:3664 stop:4404 length:741 start_codon:yes stop_codon:yes gene_type:complete